MPQKWTPRNSINLGLAAVAGLALVLAPILAPPGAPWLPVVEGAAGALLLGLLTPGSPVDSVLDRLAGPDPETAGLDPSEAAEVVRDALAERRAARRPRRLDGPEAGSVALDVLGAVVCAAAGAAVLYARAAGW